MPPKGGMWPTQYSARGVSSRLASKCELRDPVEMGNVPDYLRRKHAQGKAEPRGRDQK